jgi:flagellar L-ring protein precursor FlgH
MVLLGLLAQMPGPAKPGGKKPPEASELDRIIAEAEASAHEPRSSPGSLFDPSGRFADVSRDLRAAQVNDLVTIVVADQASAISRGTTASSRKSSASAGISAMGGPTRVAGPLSSMAGMNGDQKLDGQAETSRASELRTTLTARVTHVLPNGNLVVEGRKSVTVNAERQVVRVRGIARWNDLSGGNRINSDRLGLLEVQVDGKGVVNDAIRRPNFLYRLLLGILPF